MTATRRKPTAITSPTAEDSAARNHPNSHGSTKLRKNHRSTNIRKMLVVTAGILFALTVLLSSSSSSFFEDEEAAALLLRRQQETLATATSALSPQFPDDWVTIERLFARVSLPFNNNNTSNPIFQTLDDAQLRVNMFRRQKYAQKVPHQLSFWKKSSIPDSILMIGEAELQKRAPQHFYPLLASRNNIAAAAAAAANNGADAPQQPPEGVAMFENVYITGAPPQITFYQPESKPLPFWQLWLQKRLDKKLQGVRAFVPTSCSLNAFIQQPNEILNKITLTKEVQYLGGSSSSSSSNHNKSEHDNGIVVLIAEEWGTNYFHAMNDMAPRLSTVLDFVSTTALSGHPVTILAFFRGLMGSKAEDRIRDFWNPVLFGQNGNIDMNNNSNNNGMPIWENYNPSQLYFARRVLAPTGSLCGHLSPFKGKLFFERLNQRFAKSNYQQKTLQRRVILLQRRTGRKRTVSNHDELRTALQLQFNHNFDIWEHDATKHATLTQYEPLYAHASYLVGPHGANMANMLFCNQDKLRGVLEFHPKVSNWHHRNGTNMPNLCLMKMAKGIGIKNIRYLVMNDGENFGNMTADIPRIVETLREMIRMDDG